MRVPNHIGIIPDGNRRWAVQNGMTKEMGYEYGLGPGMELFKLCKEAGIKELTYYGFTVDNTKRPKPQSLEFTRCCVDAVKMLSKEDAELLVLGNTESAMFPKELVPFTKRHRFGKGGIKLNFLVNYGWDWDLSNVGYGKRNSIMSSIYSADISRIDLIIRWGGRRRLSGFLPVQAVYADFFVLEDYWPDFKPDHLYEALKWYNSQDVTLGG